MSLPWEIVCFTYNVMYVYKFNYMYNQIYDLMVEILLNICCLGQQYILYYALYIFYTGEIERCLKKVNEGVETFEDIWQKVT